MAVAATVFGWRQGEGAWTTGWSEFRVWTSDGVRETSNDRNGTSGKYVNSCRTLWPLMIDRNKYVER